MEKEGSERGLSEKNRRFRNRHAWEEVREEIMKKEGSGKRPNRKSNNVSMRMGLRESWKRGGREK